MCGLAVASPRDAAADGRAAATAATAGTACLHPSAAAAAHDGAPAPEVLAKAEADSSGGRLDDAGVRFRDLALSNPDTAESFTAVKRYLETLNVLGTKQNRVACFDDLATDVPKLRELHCGGSSAKKEAETCVLVDKIDADLKRLKAQKLVEAGDRGALPTGVAHMSDATKALYEQGANAYLDLFQEHCSFAVTAPATPRVSVSACEEIGFNAARAFSAAHETAKAIAAYRLMLVREDRTKPSALTAKARYYLGGAYQSIGLYEQAAEAYERYAALGPRSEYAPEALQDAAILRLGLGQDLLATKDAALFATNWGITRRPDAAALALAIATFHFDHSAKDQARAELVTATQMLDRGPLDLTMRAHLLLARLAPTPAVKKEELARLRAMWSDPAQAEEAVRRAYPSEDQRQTDRRVARCLNAVGEAMFEAAEERRIADVEPLKFPVYLGPADRTSVLAHVQSKVKDWYLKKKAAIELVEPEYVKILEIRPAPPPTWVIAAGGVVGAMWGELADDFRRVPIPDSWRRDRALYNAYFDAIDSLSESIKSRYAKPAMRKCVDLAAKYNFFDPRSRACEVWLSTNYKSEYHFVDEIIPQLRQTGAASPAHAAPLDAVLQ